MPEAHDGDDLPADPGRRRGRRAGLLVGLLALVLTSGAVAMGLPRWEQAPDPSSGAAAPVLTRTGGLTVTEPGTVVQGQDVRGAINIKANNVTVRDTTVTYGGYHSIRIFDGVSGTRILDTTVTCTGERTNGIVFGDYVAERVSLTGCRNGFMSSPDNPATVIDGWVDGQWFGALGEADRPSVEPSPEPSPAPTTDALAVSTPASAPPPSPVDEAVSDVVAPDKRAVMSRAGPRRAPKDTLSGAQAVQRVEKTGRLSDVKVNGSLDLSRVDRGYTIRDVTVDAQGASYGIRTMVGYSGVGRPTGKQLIEHVEVYGATSAGLYLRDVTVRHADVWGNIDNVKSADRVEVYASWLHDQSWTEGAHADAIQIQYGVDQYWHGNVIDARYGDAVVAGVRAGENSNAALQTGRMLGEASARFHDNWWNGGHYTVRLGNGDSAPVDYQFRDNRFGLDFTYDVVSGSRDEPSTFGGVTFDDSNVSERDGRAL